VPIEELSEFVEKLEKAGELKRVKTQVDTNLEISEILSRIMYSNGSAVLFENVKNYEFPWTPAYDLGLQISSTLVLRY